MAKPSKRLIQYDGMKMASLWGGVEDGWVIQGAPDQQTKDVQDLAKSIPWLFRGRDLRANAVAAMPFALVKTTEKTVKQDGESEDFDTSQDWQNKLGFMPNPAELLWKIEASLTMTGKAYNWREFNAAAIRNLKYVAPQSVEYEIKPDGKILWKRDLGDGRGAVPVPDKSIVYYWMHDPFVELGAAKAYPAQAALSAAGVLSNMDAFISAFFKRGAIKTTVFSALGMSKPQAEEFEAWYKKLVTGIKNAFSTKIFNADKMEPVVIGEGIQELANVTLTDDKKRDIAAALGIPVGILFSEATNFATAQQDDLNFLSKTIVPECRFIEGVLNEQVFAPLGLRFEFREETLDAFQEDENQRAEALDKYITAGFELVDACDLLGVELSKAMRAKYEELEKEKRKQAEELAAQLGKPGEQQQPGQPAQKPVLEPEKSYQLDLDKWQRKALNALERGKSANVEFQSTVIPFEVGVAISRALNGAQTADEVKAVFGKKSAEPVVKLVGYQPPAPREPDIDPLINELRLARLALVAEDTAPMDTSTSTLDYLVSPIKTVNDIEAMFFHATSAVEE